MFFKVNKEVANAIWMIGGKVMQMLINLVVGLLTARYLGPANYGLINYAATYVAFFSSLCSLGINAVITKDFIDDPAGQGAAIGTAIGLRQISSLFSLITIFCASIIIDNTETTTIAVVVLSSLSLLFNLSDILNCWFLYKYQAKVTTTVSFFAYLMMAIYKIILLISGKNVLWFSIATSIDYIVISLLLLIVYQRQKGPKFLFSMKKARSLLRKSYPYILSGMMVTVYAQTDKLMLKQMLTIADVGYYSTATAISGMWTFVLASIIDAVFPTIYRVYNRDKEEFNRTNRQLYSIVIYVSVLVSLVFAFFGRYAILFLYGQEYLPALEPLRIITWGTVFSYLGVARHAWIVCENVQRHLSFISFMAAVINVVMNFIMIPLLGVSGAALASVLSQFMVCFVVPIFIKELRPNIKLMIDAMFLKNVFNSIKKDTTGAKNE